MSDWPDTGQAPSRVIHPWSDESLGVLAGRLSSTAATAIVVPAANLSWYVPFVLTVPFTVRQLFWFNGSVTAGNVDCGIAAEDGTRIVSTGSTAQSGTNTMQKPTTTVTVLDPGCYYMGLSWSDATARFFAATSSAAIWQTCGCAQESAGPALSAKWTPTTIASAFMPVFGFADSTST